MVSTFLGIRFSLRAFTVAGICSMSFPSMAATFSKGLPFYNANDMTPYWSDSGQSQDRTAQPAAIGKFQAIDQNNKKISEEQFRGHLSLVNFFFSTCPSLCPMMMNSLNSFKKTFNVDERNALKLYSFSVHPGEDTAEILTAFAKQHHLSIEGWHLLTGEQKQIFHVGRDMFHADGSVGPQKDENTFIHTRNVYLVDEKLRIRGVYDTGKPKSMALLKADIDQLLSQRP